MLRGFAPLDGLINNAELAHAADRYVLMSASSTSAPRVRCITGQNFVVDGGMTRRMIYAQKVT